VLLHCHQQKGTTKLWIVSQLLHNLTGCDLFPKPCSSLDTVIDHDYILVLGQGKVLEFGSPADLLKSGGAFSQMVDDTGEINANELRQRAFNRR
jgi:hypothetical protein